MTANRFSAIFRPTEQSGSGILGSIWSLGFGKADSVEEYVEKKEEKPKRKTGFLNSLVSSVFVTNIMEVR